MTERIYSFLAIVVRDFKHKFLVVGCVPTCQVGAALWKEYRTNSSHENARPIPIGGLILQSALYSGSSALIGGCLIRRKDPYNNGAEVSHISVCL